MNIYPKSILITAGLMITAFSVLLTCVATANTEYIKPTLVMLGKNWLAWALHYIFVWYIVFLTIKRKNL